VEATSHNFVIRCKLNYSTGLLLFTALEANLALSGFITRTDEYPGFGRFACINDCNRQPWETPVKVRE